MSPINRASLDRWMFSRDGMDYGPFSVRDIEKMIEAGELTGESEINNYRSKVSGPVKSVPHFAEFMAEKEKRDRAAAHKAEVERDTNQALARSRRSHTGPLIIGAVILVGGLIGSWFLLRDPEIPTSGYPAQFFRDLTIPMLKPITQRLASPVEFQAEKKVAAVQNAAPRRKPKPMGFSEPGVVAEVVLDMSPETTGEGATRELNQEDVDELKQSVTPGLIRCFQNELDNIEDFKGGRVVFFVMPKGKVALSKVETNPAASGTLVSCVTSTINSKKVRPYAGAIQIVEFPLHVSND